MTSRLAVFAAVALIIGVKRAKCPPTVSKAVLS
jgi:hypothetical protein